MGAAWEQHGSSMGAAWEQHGSGIGAATHEPRPSHTLNKEQVLQLKA